MQEGFDTGERTGERPWNIEAYAIGAGLVMAAWLGFAAWPAEGSVIPFVVAVCATLVLGFAFPAWPRGATAGLATGWFLGVYFATGPSTDSGLWGVIGLGGLLALPLLSRLGRALPAGRGWPRSAISAGAALSLGVMLVAAVTQWPDPEGELRDAWDFVAAGLPDGAQVVRTAVGEDRLTAEVRTGDRTPCVLAGIVWDEAGMKGADDGYPGAPCPHVRAEFPGSSRWRHFSVSFQTVTPRSDGQRLVEFTVKY